MTTIAERLACLRAEMRERGYDALVIPRADEYLGEYLPAHNERLHWATGFTGSAGVAIVLADSAAIFVDGRYTVQVRQEVDSALFQVRDLVAEPHVQWLAGVLPAGATVACDPRLHTLAWHTAAARTLSAAGHGLASDSNNLVDRCWAGRPAPQIAPALLLGEHYTGVDSFSKRSRIAAAVAAAGADAALVFAPDSVSWLLNVRGTDIPCLPVLQSFALLYADGQLDLFVDSGRIPAGFAEHVGAGVSIFPESAAAQRFATLAGKRVIADPESANAWSQLALQEAGAQLLAQSDPVLLPKACKNAVEIDGARAAHRRDAVAEVRFLAWLDAEVAAGRLHDEDLLARKLGEFRDANADYHGPSFDTISAAGGNAAMCHYNHRNADVPGRLAMDSVYLVDSGGQYSDGTTDITRTVAIGDPGAEVRRLFTLVLKGHIALDRARFPAGTSGTQLDALARQHLWQHGYDFAHGTGHGVGAFLSVHEGPQRIAKAWNGTALAPGMIVSNEPGYYRDGEFGIRCENLVVVRECEAEGETPVYGFEALTLVPFDRRLLDESLLSDAERRWLNDYHTRVRETISPLLEAAEQSWLEQATAAL